MFSVMLEARLFFFPLLERRNFGGAEETALVPDPDVWTLLWSGAGDLLLGFSG